MRRWIVYALYSPIDWWDGVLTPMEHIEKAHREDVFSATNRSQTRKEQDHSLLSCAEQHCIRVNDYLGAIRAAESAGFCRNGTCSECVMHIPDNGELRIGYVFKHHDNGDTFVVTPLPMTHLDRGDATRSEFVYDDADADDTLEDGGKFIYFLRMGDLIKIGVTQDVNQRIKSYSKTEYPYKPELLATCPGGFAKEKELHARFAHARVKGEWFSQVPELMQYIEAITTTGRNDS